MLRIEVDADGQRTILRLSGRIQYSHLPELQAQIEKCALAPQLDLGHVSLVDRETIGFLIDCEGRGVEIWDCPSFIRQWMFRERLRAGRQSK